MNFFGDLDGPTITLTVVTVLVNLVCLAYLINEGRLGRGFGAPLALVFLCFGVAYDAYCPDADQPHIQVTGMVQPVRLYAYHSGKSSYTGVLACLNACGDNAPLMAFEEGSRWRLGWIRGFPVRSLTLIYLGRTEEADVGGSRMMLAHPVVEVSNPLTGERVFYRDTTRHWPRVTVLLADGLIGILAFLVFVRMAKAHPAPEEDGGSQSEAGDAMPNELTALGLGAKDDRKS